MSEARRIAIAVDSFAPYPHHQGVLRGAIRYAREHGWAWVLDEHPGGRIKSRVKGRDAYDGVIARASPALQRRLKRAGTPLVNVWLSQHRPGLAGVYPDYEASGRLSAEHLISRGHRQLHVLTAEGRGPEDSAARTFVHSAEQEGLSWSRVPYPIGDHENMDDWISWERQLVDWLAGIEMPAAVLVGTIMMARLLTDLCQQAGIHVPQDLSVLCLMDQKDIAEVPTSVSSVGFDYEACGYRAASLLSDLMDGVAAPKEPVLIRPTGIIGRASTDHFAVQDELVQQALRYISDHLREDLQVEKIAYVLAVSLRALHNRFKSALGHGVGTEVRRLRVSTARRLLADPTLSIEEAAAQAGFASPDVMRRVFKRDLGEPPSAFRKS